MEQKPLPNATAALVLGILSIPITCLCYGIIGLGMGIVAIVLGGQAVKTDAENPGVYTGAQNAKVGRILGIISVALAVIYLLFLVLVFAGMMAQPEFMDEIMRNLD